MEKKLTQLDPQQIEKMTYDEDKNAKRVFVVNDKDPITDLKYLRVEKMVIENVIVPTPQPVDRLHIKHVPYLPLWARLLMVGETIFLVWYFLTQTL